jgi:hypothetical protein
MAKASSRLRPTHAPERPLTVKVPSRYWAADSPLDGISLAVWVGLLHLARRTEERARARDSHGDSHAPRERDRHAAIERGDVHPAQSIRDANMQPLKLADMCRFVKLPRHQVQHAITQLEAAGELARAVDGAYILAGYKLAQENPGTERKRKQRARDRCDSHGDSHAACERDSHGDSHAAERDSHAVARAVSDLKEREETQILPAAALTQFVTAARARPHDSGVYAVPTEIVGHRWYHELIWSTCTLSAPTPTRSSKHFEAYQYMGAAPAAERERVAACARAVLTGLSEPAYWFTPSHVMDHWAHYLSGNPPRLRGSAPPPRPGETQAELEQTRADFERASVANQPSWLTVRADGARGAT